MRTAATGKENDALSELERPRPHSRGAYQDEARAIDVPRPGSMLGEQIKEKWDSILSLVVMLGTLLGIINPRFDAMERRFHSLEAKVDANTIAITELNGRIDAVEAKLDSKFNNLANMMIVAHTNGDVTAEELVAIWERVIEA